MSSKKESSKQNSLPFKNLSPGKEYFLGAVLSDALFPFPDVNPNEKETLSMIIESIDRFMEGKEAAFAEYDKKGQQPDDYLNALRELGLFGLIIPEEFGGLGLSAIGYSRALQQISRYDGSTGLTVGAHSSIGMKGLLLFGNQFQKEMYLPRLATGELVASFCLTEAGSGSDAASIKTTAVKDADGNWILNGEKIWITNGAFAGFFTVFAKTEGTEGKISAFIVERKWDGVSTGPKEDKMGIRASATTTVAFQNVNVPATHLLGDEGKGFKIAMAILNSGRTGLGGGCVGAMKRCIELATKQATERKQFGKSIAEFGLIQEKIAQMTTLCFAAESVVQMVGHYIDSGAEDYSVEAGISKIFATEALWNTAYEALQIAGGNGFMKEFPYERIVRDSRINMIFEGTNEILRLFVSLSGVKEQGDFLKSVGKGASTMLSDPIKGFGLLSTYASRKVTHMTSLGRKELPVPEDLADAARTLQVYSGEFAVITESVIKKYGKGIVDQQLILRRLADVAIDLFVGSCVLSRVVSIKSDKKMRAAQKENAVIIARTFLRQARRRMNQNLRRIEKNEDGDIATLAKFILDEGKFPFDIL